MNIKGLLLGSAAALVAVSGARAPTGGRPQPPGEEDVGGRKLRCSNRPAV